MASISSKNISLQVQSRWVVLLLDMGISIVASLGAIMFVRWQVHPIVGFEHYVLVWLIASAVASVVSFMVLGTYKIVIRHSSYRSIGRLIFASMLKGLLLSAIIWFNLFRLSEPREEMMLICADFLMTMVLLIIVRVIIIVIHENLQNSIEVDVDRLCVMVYGTSNKSVSMVTRLEQSTHYNVLGFLTRDRVDAGKVIQSKRVYYYDTKGDIEKFKMNLGVQGVLFARDNDAEDEQTRENGLVSVCMDLGLHILMSPRIDEASFGGVSQQTIKEFTDSDFIPDGMTAFSRNTKRAIDFVLSSVLLVVFSPLFLICWAAIKIGGGPGPVIYRQERIGRFGRPFDIYKFRSMRADAESAGPALYSGDDDPRLTKVGKFLRQHHLDELPQLFNVWKGDMAFVGYRPERKFYIDQIMEIDPRYYYLYQIRPGVTSYATLRNGYTDTMEKMLRRLEFDLYYLRHRSLWFDIKILWQTFANIAFGKKF